jgi:hypothetical protein
MPWSPTACWDPPPRHHDRTGRPWRELQAGPAVERILELLRRLVSRQSPMLGTAMIPASQSSTACCDHLPPRQHNTRRPTRGSPLVSAAQVPSLATRLSFELNETPGSQRFISALRTLERHKSPPTLTQGHTRFSMHQGHWYHHKTTLTGTRWKLDREFEQPKPAVRTLERRKSLPTSSHWHTTLLSSPKLVIPPQSNADWDGIEAWSRVRTTRPGSAHT